MTLQQAVSESSKAADNVESQYWLTTFDAKMTALGFGNIGAKCECSHPDMGHEPECGWGPVATQENSASGFSVGNITVTQNQAHDSIEIRFASRPPQAVTSHLKDAGWHWNKTAKCWYNRRSAKTLAFAYGMIGEPVPEVEEEGLRAMTDVDSQQEDRWADQVGR